MALARLCTRNPLLQRSLLFLEAQRLPPRKYLTTTTTTTSCSMSTDAASASPTADKGQGAVGVSKEPASPSRRRQRRRGQLWKQPWNIVPFQLNEGLGSLGNALTHFSDNLHKLVEAISPSRLLGRMKEDANSYKFRFAVPGLSKEDLKITVEGRRLTITGEHKEEEEGSDEDEDDERWYAASYGYYNTSFLLPDDAKVEEIKAEVKHGMLYVTVPRTGEGKGDCARVIQIN